MATTNVISNGAQAPIRKVLVFGDNRVSSSILAGIVGADLEVHQITHSQSAQSSNDSVTIYKTDFSLTSLASFFSSITPDIIFSTQSAGSYDFQKQLIDLAISAQIPRFIAAEFSQDALSPKVQTRLPPYAEKAKVIQHLQQNQSHIEWLGISTGCTPLEHALLSGNIGFSIKWLSATLPGTGNERFAASSSLWIGRVAHSIIHNWDGIKNQYLYCAGLITTGKEILDGLQATTGRKWAADYGDVGDLVSEAEGRFQRGFPDAGMFLMERSVLFDEDLDAVRPFVERDAKTLLGLDGGEDLKGVIEQVVHEHEHHSKGDCGCD